VATRKEGSQFASRSAQPSDARSRSSLSDHDCGTYLGELNYAMSRNLIADGDACSSFPVLALVITPRHLRCRDRSLARGRAVSMLILPSPLGASRQRVRGHLQPSGPPATSSGPDVSFDRSVVTAISSLLLSFVNTTLSREARFRAPCHPRRSAAVWRLRASDWGKRRPSRGLSERGLAAVGRALVTTTLRLRTSRAKKKKEDYSITEMGVADDDG